MVNRELRVLQLPILLAAVAGRAPATLDRAVADAALSRDAVVSLTNELAVGARREENSVEVLKFEPDPDSGSWSTSVTAGGSPAPASGSAHLTSQDGTPVFDGTATFSEPLHRQ